MDAGQDLSTHLGCPLVARWPCCVASTPKVQSLFVHPECVSVVAVGVRETCLFALFL